MNCECASHWACKRPSRWLSPPLLLSSLYRHSLVQLLWDLTVSSKSESEPELARGRAISRFFSAATVHGGLGYHCQGSNSRYQFLPTSSSHLKLKWWQDYRGSSSNRATFLFCLHPHCLQRWSRPWFEFIFYPFFASVAVVYLLL